MQPVLEKLVTSDTDIEIETTDPRFTAYKIREAIHSAKKNKVERYANLGEQWRFIEDSGKVICRLRAVSTYELHMKEVAKPIARMTIPEVTGLHGVIGAAIENPNQEELIFPDAVLTDEELSKLHRWTSINKYFIIVKEGLTLTKRNSEEQWQPQS